MSAQAQSITPAVISSIGDFSSCAQGSISWTIGEPISGSYSNTTNSISTGMQQNDLPISSLVNEITGKGTIVSYPNPVTSELRMNFLGMEKGTYHLQLINMSGQIIYQQNETIADMQYDVLLPFKELPAGNYLLHISNTKEMFNTIKIRKN